MTFLTSAGKLIEQYSTRILSQRKAGVMAMLLLSVACFQQNVFAQLTSGDLSGVVADPTGAVVANATVTATNTLTGVKATQTSGGSGDYHFANLPIGTYDLVFNGKGFATLTIKSILELS